MILLIIPNLLQNCKIRKQDYNYKNHSITVLEDTDFTKTLTKDLKISSNVCRRLRQLIEC